MLQVELHKISELHIAAKKILENFPENKIFAFYGQMGAGKTTFIKIICETLGVKEIVSSPTFSLVNESLNNTLSRTLKTSGTTLLSIVAVLIFGGEVLRGFAFGINNISEAYDMGYEEYFYSNSFCFIEWPEKIVELLPDNFVKVNISLEGEKRKISAILG